MPPTQGLLHSRLKAAGRTCSVEMKKGKTKQNARQNTVQGSGHATDDPGDWRGFAACETLIQRDNVQGLSAVGLGSSGWRGEA